MAIPDDGAYTRNRGHIVAVREPKLASETAEARMCRDDAAALLRKIGINPTAQRIEIASVLLARPQHLCADELRQVLARTGTPVSKATVYNTLGLFAREGLVRELFVDSGKVVYDSNTTCHDHIYDVDTGVLTDIEPGTVAVEALPTLPAGTRVEGIDVVIRISRVQRA